MLGGGSAPHGALGQRWAGLGRRGGGLGEGHRPLTGSSPPAGGGRRVAGGSWGAALCEGWGLGAGVRLGFSMPGPGYAG